MRRLVCNQQQFHIAKLSEFRIEYKIFTVPSMFKFETYSNTVSVMFVENVYYSFAYGKKLFFL